MSPGYGQRLRDPMRVMTEFETMAEALAGTSIARFGDGELKLAMGRDAKSQRADPNLESRLRAIIMAPAGPCLVCLPGPNEDSPKYKLWRSYATPPYTYLYRPRGDYGSAFITRPDSAPWIDTPEYWDRVIDLWRGRDVVLVGSSGKGLHVDDLSAAASVHHIKAPAQHAFEIYHDLFQLLRKERRRVILCLGATATVLAYNLAHEGVHALDLGHIGMFLRRHVRGDPVVKGE